MSGRKDVTLIDNTEFLFLSTTGGRFVYFEAGGRKHVSRFLRPGGKTTWMYLKPGGKTISTMGAGGGKCNRYITTGFLDILQKLTN